METQNIWEGSRFQITHDDSTFPGAPYAIIFSHELEVPHSRRAAYG